MMDYEKYNYTRNIYTTASGGELILSGSISGSFSGKIWGSNGTMKIQNGKEEIYSNYKCHTEYTTDIKINDIIYSDTKEWKVVWIVERLKKFKEIYMVGNV